MNVDVVTSRFIARPRAHVAGFAADPDHAPRWYGNIRSVVWETPPPAAVGTRVAFVASFLGRRLAYTYEIVAWEPGERMVMHTASGPFPMETTYTWRDEPGGTRMTLRNRGAPTGFAALTAPVLSAAMRRANEGDLARLAAMLGG